MDRIGLGLFSTVGPDTSRVETSCYGTLCSSGCNSGTNSASQLLTSIPLPPVICSDCDGA
jgi:hypothetical protein